MIPEKTAEVISFLKCRGYLLSSSWPRPESGVNITHLPFGLTADVWPSSPRPLNFLAKGASQESTRFHIIIPMVCNPGFFGGSIPEASNPPHESIDFFLARVNASLNRVGSPLNTPLTPHDTHSMHPIMGRLGPRGLITPYMDTKPPAPIRLLMSM